MKIRIPLNVEAQFLKSGKIKPRRIIVDERTLEITKVLDIRPFYPSVSSIAPLEYTVLIEGLIKKIYFEAETSKWFAVGEDNGN